MTLICGTDFSDASAQAVRVATQLAKRMQVPLHLVHSVEYGAESQFEQPRKDAERWAQTQLARAAAHCEEVLGRVQTHIVSTPPDEALEEIAARTGGTLIIIAALGTRRSGAWQLGAHAERLAHRARVPVLVVRDAKPFEAWVQGQRPLRILLGADLSRTSQAAMAFIHRLASFGPCEVTAAHLYWSSEAALGDTSDPSVKDALGRELQAQLDRGLGGVAVTLHLEPQLSSGIGTRLAQLASEKMADLAVVGTHGRSEIDPALLGSISHTVAHCAATSVACIPASEALAPMIPRQPDSVLVATDFSDTGNAAVGVACSIVRSGGTVHLVHVVSDRERHPENRRHMLAANEAAGAASESSALPRQLLELVPADARAQVEARAHVITGGNVAQTVCEAAERLDAGFLCIGTHGCSGLSSLLLGSVAQAIVSGTKRPVLLVRPPKA